MSGFLGAIATAPTVAPDALIGDRPLTILAPHPDDETLACGALLFDAAAAGTPCQVICVSDGARSHASQEWPAPRLAAERRRELEAAVAMLAPSARIEWLGHPDCAIPDEAAAQIAELIPPRALVLASWGGDPHIDHETVARLAQTVAAQRPDVALMFYPVWGRFTDTPAQGWRIEASAAALAAKRRALACHRTQMTRLIADDPDGFVMEEWRQQHFLTHAEIVLAP